MNTLEQLLATIDPASVMPPAPDAPPELKAVAAKGLAFVWFAALVSCVGMAFWGLGSLAWASKNQNFGGVNSGKKVAALSLAGAAMLGTIGGVFGWFGVVV